MMGQEKKPIEEVLDSLDGKKKIAVIGCGGCSTVFHTGGIEEVNEMAEILTKQEKKVTPIGLPFAVFACYKPFSSMFVEKFKKDLKDCDAVLIMSCGDGLQTIREILDGTRKDGKCEVDAEKDCAWYLIYNRLKNIGELDKINNFVESHDWSKVTRPRVFEREPLDIHKHLGRTKELIESLGI